MSGPGPRDLTALHRRLLEAKGGTFGAVSVQPEPLSWRERLGPVAHRIAARVRRVRR